MIAEPANYLRSIVGWAFEQFQEHIGFLAGLAQTKHPPREAQGGILQKHPFPQVLSLEADLVRWNVRHARHHFLVLTVEELGAVSDK
jgi:hypothetical protein